MSSHHLHSSSSVTSHTNWRDPMSKLHHSLLLTDNSFRLVDVTTSPSSSTSSSSSSKPSVGGTLSLFTDRLIFTPSSSSSNHPTTPGYGTIDILCNDIANVLYLTTPSDTSDSAAEVPSLQIITYVHPSSRSFFSTCTGSDPTVDLSTRSKVVYTLQYTATDTNNDNRMYHRCLLWLSAMYRVSIFQGDILYDTILHENRQISSSSSSSSNESPLLIDKHMLQHHGPLASLYNTFLSSTLSSTAPATSVVYQILMLSLPTARSPKKYLVYLSPAAGAGQAESIWHNQCATVFKDCYCDCEVIVTKSAGYAEDEVRCMAKEKLFSYYGIVAVGGDGTLSEVVRGIMARKDWFDITQNVAIGILPAGSGNGLIASLLYENNETFSIPNAAYLVARGGISRLDLSSMFILNNGEHHVLSGHHGKTKDEPVPHVFNDTTVRKGHGKNGNTTTEGTPTNEPTALQLRSPTDPSTTANHGTDIAVVVMDDGKDQSFNNHETLLSTVSSASTATSSSFHPHPSHPRQLSHVRPILHDGHWGDRLFSFLSLEWGLVADLDVESELLRCLGGARFDVYGFIRGLFLRKYTGTFSYLPAVPFTSSQAHEALNATVAMERDFLTNKTNPSGGTGIDTVSTTNLTMNRSFSPSFSSPSSVRSVSSLSFRVNGEGGYTPPPSSPSCSHLVPFDRPVPLSWKNISGVFTFLWITTTTHQSTTVSCAPNARLDDGVFTVTLIRDVSPLTMISILLALDTKGSQANHPHVETFTCSAFRLIPEPRNKRTTKGKTTKTKMTTKDIPTKGNTATTVPHKDSVTDEDETGPSGTVSSSPSTAAASNSSRSNDIGHVCIDGEDVDYGPIQAEIHPGLLRVLGPYRENIDFVNEIKQYNSMRKTDPSKVNVTDSSSGTKETL